MNRTFAPLVIVVMTLVSCGTQATPAPTPTDTPMPSETPLPTPTHTPSPTVTPTVTPAPILFRDDFDVQLADGWEWVREVPGDWSLTNVPGWLQIKLRAGSIYEGNIHNLMLYAAPQGDFELETKLRFKPISNFQAAGLFVYESRLSFVHFTRAFCSQPWCTGDGMYFDSGENDQWSGENFNTPAPNADTVYLRLRREGNTHTAYFSPDGQTWSMMGMHTNGLNPMFVGLEAGQGLSGLTTEFDYFQIIKLP